MGAMVKTAAEISAGIPAPLRGDTSKTRRPRSAHGTDAGWHRHKRRGEQPCPPCHQAHRAADRAAWRRRSPWWPIREWAKAKGLPVAPAGRLIGWVIDAYRAEHPDGGAK